MEHHHQTERAPKNEPSIIPYPGQTVGDDDQLLKLFRTLRLKVRNVVRADSPSDCALQIQNHQSMWEYLSARRKFIRFKRALAAFKTNGTASTCGNGGASAEQGETDGKGCPPWMVFLRGEVEMEVSGILMEFNPINLLSLLLPSDDAIGQDPDREWIAGARALRALAEDLARRYLFVAQVGQDVIVCRVPIKVHLDGAGRIHREDGPAVVYQNNECAHYLHGVFLPENWYYVRETTSAMDILSLTNLELRRTLIERMGMDRFLEETNAELRSSDDYGSLYTIRRNMHLFGLWSQGDELVVLVRLLNSTPEPGTDDVFREYLVQVPPEMQTPRQAVAWSFRMEESEYAPCAES